MSAALSFGASSLVGTQVSPFTARPVRSRPCPLIVTAAAIGPGKKWEKYELNKNGKVVRKPMHVKTGDVVVVIAGSDKGKTGKVERVNTKTGQLYIDGVNVSTRHMKPVSQGDKGKIEMKEAPIHHSNVMHWSETEKTRSRVGFQVSSDGKKVRVLKKTGEVLPN